MQRRENIIHPFPDLIFAIYINALRVKTLKTLLRDNIVFSPDFSYTIVNIPNFLLRTNCVAFSFIKVEGTELFSEWQENYFYFVIENKRVLIDYSAENHVVVTFTSNRKIKSKKIKMHGKVREFRNKNIFLMFRTKIKLISDS